MRIEGGPEASGLLDKAYDMLARHQGEDKFDTLQDAFGIEAEGIDPLDDWDGDNAEVFFHCTLGPTDTFADEYDRMSENERLSLFPDPVVSKINVV